MICSRAISKKVCVIGAGPSGLVTAREMRKEGHNVVVLEQNHDIGGQWLYNPEVEDEDPLGKNDFMKVHSSVYSSLRLASPREIMGFTDFPFVIKKDRDVRRFPGHREVLLYLQDFCDYFELRGMIRFNTVVVNVQMLEYPGVLGEDLKWVVRSKEVEKEVEEVFDAVVVATGHYSKPRLPKIKGMDVWRRKQLHSHVYRIPEPFKNEVVVVVGSSISGQDISMELVDVAKKIHLSAKSSHAISQGLSKVISKYDTLHLHPQLIGFPFFEAQAKWIAQLLCGKTRLPSWDDMMLSIEEFYQSRDIAGIPKNHTHDISSFEYCDKYGDYIGFPRLEKWRKELCLSSVRNAEIDLETFRDVYHEDEEMLQQAYQSSHFTQIIDQSRIP
ncbi:flavin-containing monooxygenase FMO GS-OX-like 9 isoform X2 [Primulina eburnea]|uniref:flavin-containing monooxygenase FMO GS-OX-like 9 isoform X2 n=1 Tax=Primulina eburnea TaxID=1245227 RepID=UPI003C6CBC53